MNFFKIQNQKNKNLITLQEEAPTFRG
jgi:hypothetical protein